MLIAEVMAIVSIKGPVGKIVDPARGRIVSAIDKLKATTKTSNAIFI